MELGITDEAAEEFKKSVEDIEPKPYLRVGATKGGCSGWTFSLGTESFTPLNSNTSLGWK